MCITAANMANLSAYQRTKCSSWWNLWYWCLTIQFLFYLPCISTKEQESLLLWPQTRVLEYGKSLELFCMSLVNEYTSKNITFKLGDKPLESQEYNKTTIRLFVEKPEKNQYTFVCRNNELNRNEVLRVTVDTAPSDVTDFKCVSTNLEILNCTWTSPTQYITTYFKLYLYTKGQRTAANITTVGNENYASWNESSKPRYRQQEKEFFFILNSENSFGTHSQNITINHYAIVKPAAPMDLSVVKNDSNSVTLQWYIHNNLLDFIPKVVQRIEFQIAKIDNIDFFRTVNTSLLPDVPHGYGNDGKWKPFTFTIPLPYAYMDYNIRIYVKTAQASDKYWSEHAHIFVKTKAIKPSRPPDTVIGGFEQAIYTTHRFVRVYWKQLKLFEENGPNFTYSALVKQDNRSTPVHPDKNKSMSYIDLDKPSMGEIFVSIWSQNDMGLSPTSSSIYIPSAKESPPSLTSFTKLAYINSTYELSWVNTDKFDSCTLFWCQYNTTNQCNGGLDFKVLNGSLTKYSIDLPKERRYQFAISANQKNRSSGMVWTSKCEISEEGISMYQFPMTLTWDAPGNTYVKLKWSMECALKDGIIIGYQIEYCPIIKTSNICDPKMENKTESISNPKLKEYNITNLLPSRTYQFTIALKTIKGIKTIENSTVSATTLEDTPTNPINIAITDIKNDSFVVSWDPPKHRNGKIGKYVINNFNQKLYEVEPEQYNIDAETTKRHSVTLYKLTPFTNYSITVQACNIAIQKCSQPGLNDAIINRTQIGRPSQLKPPSIYNNPDVIKWEKPDIAGGTLDQYQIRVIKDDNYEEIINATHDMSFSTVHCDGVISVEKYQVRAVNYYEDDTSDLIPYFGDWSDPTTVACNQKEGLTTIYIILAVLTILALIYGSVKLSKWKLERDDLKPPKFPDTLRITEKDAQKFASPFGNWNPADKDEKPSSDEMLLLPGSKSTVSTPEIKNNDIENCAVSDHTDSTALSESSRGPTERQASVSDASSSSSLHIDADTKDSENIPDQDDNISDSNSECSNDGSPYLSEKAFKKNPTTGYVQPVSGTANGYVQSGNIPKPQAASSSYVMAGLSPPIFTTGVSPVALPNNLKPSSGYVRAEDLQARPINMPKLGPSPTKVFGPESLPSPLPVPSKRQDSSYIQLQSLDSSLKPSVRNAMPMKARTGGYVSPEDAVLNKHLSNMLSPALDEEPALLDPTMSPDAYCRFSWNTDPNSDNLHSLLTDSPATNHSKN